MGSAASLAGMQADIDAGKALLASKGLAGADEGWRHFCYPFGDTWGIGRGVFPTRAEIAAATYDGGTSVAIGAAPANPIAAGDTWHGYKVPSGTTVVTVNAQSGSNAVVLSNPVAAGTSRAMSRQEGGEFFYNGIQTRLAAAGYKTGRTTVAKSSHEHNIVLDQGLWMPGQGTSDISLASLNTLTDRIMLTGEVLLPYIHEYRDGSPAGSPATIHFYKDQGEP